MNPVNYLYLAALLFTIGATGVLKGTGVPFKWANQTWFYPEGPISGYELADGLRPYFEPLRNYWGASGDPLTLKYLFELFNQAGAKITLQQVEADWQKLALKGRPAENMELDRRAAAVLTDHYLQPFLRKVDFSGQLHKIFNKSLLT